MKTTGKTLTAVFFPILWMLLNLVQAGLLELTSDEGYYWFYSRSLEWGYYDHPPMIGLLVRLGTEILPGELGVRFIYVVIGSTGLYLFLRLLEERIKEKTKTYWIILAAPLLHYLSFIVFPDGPLVFFSLLFLLFYKRFLVSENLPTALGLGLSLALMAYSKYQGGLILLFVVIANPRLLKSGYFYLSLLVAAILLVPHLYWQYQHGFISMKYHLFGRSEGWSIKHVGEYLSQQIIAFGPFIIAPFLIKTADLFERTLKLICVGTFVFFLLTSFSTFVHFHWTSIALYPVLYFAILFYSKPGNKKWYSWLFIPLAVLVFIVRIIMLLPVPGLHVGVDYYNGRKQWSDELAAIAGSKTVLMLNNLREPAFYSFYTGRNGVTLYDRPEKKSQYDIAGYEDSLQGKTVLVLANYPFAGSQELETSIQKKLHFAIIDTFTSYYNRISIEPLAGTLSETGSNMNVTISITNHRSDSLRFEKPGNSLIYSIERKKKIYERKPIVELSPVDNIGPGQSINKEVFINKDNLPSGKYKVYFGIRNGVLPDAILSKPMNLSVN